MANPQKETGFTPISNDILEAAYKTKLNGTQYRIIIFLLRYTYGFHLTENTLSERYIASGTGIDRANISKELKHLIKCKIINVISEPTYTKPRILALNENYSEWLSKYQQVAECQHLANAPTQQLVMSPTPTVGELTPNKRKHINKTYKENIIYCTFFDSLWNLYPCKKGKSRVSKKALKEINAIGFNTMKECIERYINNKPEWQQWQHGSTFFNGGYKDYLMLEQSEHLELPKGEKQPTRYGGTYL